MTLGKAFAFFASGFKESWILVSLYSVVILSLFLYSFTQVDLSLTLSRASIWQDIQRSFQYIGYFNRPLSTYLYISLILLLFNFYFYLLWRAYKKTLSRKTVWALIVITAGILLFSYNAFSYDLFNYIFDAKIITYYGQNPYEHKALDYAGDPMLSFMRWTHRTYPYGPLWLVLTVPLSFFGLQFFLPTFFLFKALMVASYIGSAYFIGKILRKVSPERELMGLIFFAFNPLVIVESLVSAHNDIVMMFFAILGVYYLVEKKYKLTFFAFIASYGVKFATASLPFALHIGAILGIAAFLNFMSRQKNIHLQWQRHFVILTFLMILPVVFASYRTTFQPWYLLYLLGFAALVSNVFFVTIPVVILSFFAILQYIPYLYLGNWDPPVPSILAMLLYWGIVLSIVLTGSWFGRRLFATRIQSKK